MENNRIEFKKDIPQKQNQLKAEIVSFLNTDGGEIYLGVDDDGNILEDIIDENSKKWEETLSNWISNAFCPDVSSLISVFSNDIPFKIIVKRGDNKPYFYKDGEGFNSKGVYIRIGSTKRLASFDEIRRMIREHKSQDYESLSCGEKNLTFEYLANKFKEKDIKFDEYGLSLLTKNNDYNNAALLLSDQNPTISKFAVFQGTNVSTFLDKKEFRGSILKQLDDMLYFAGLSNRKKIVITGKAYRNEHFDIPEKAIREAIVNCYCHRDWTLSGDIKVEFYDDKVMIFSPGSLPDGLTLENIKMGMSAKRNPKIVNVLDKIDVIENYASGVRRIFEDYTGFKKLPEYYISNNGVIVTLFNRNYDAKNDVENDAKNDVENDVQSNIQKPNKKERQKIIIGLMMQNRNITIDDIKDYLGVSKPTAERDIASLRRENKIKYVGSAKKGYWKVYR